MSQKPVPGYRAMIEAWRASAASAPTSAIAAESLLAARSSSSGSTTMMIMPKIESTSSGRMRM